MHNQYAKINYPVLNDAVMKENQTESCIAIAGTESEATKIKPQLQDLQESNHANDPSKSAPKTTKLDDFEILKTLFRSFTSYDLSQFSTFTNFTQWLHRPVDGSALGVFRLCYGLAMLIDIAEERGGSQMDIRFGESQHCHFPLFNFIHAASFPIMGCIYLCMWLGALGITLGYHFRSSCLAYIVPYWYIFLLDKPTWNNHSYLFGLVGTILLFTQANCYCSVDKLLNPSLPTIVPYWNYFLIKFQFFILYSYAGLKKFTSEWLSGYAMTNLSRHWVFTPFRSVLSAELTDLLIVHWFTAIFDFSIPFLMTWEKTRLLATPFMLSFHCMNTRLFLIGMFPWVCLAQVPLFFSFDWPRKLKFKHLINYFRNTTTRAGNITADTKITTTTKCKQSSNSSLTTQSENKISLHSCLRTVVILSYCFLQLFLPYSHFITKGYNNWTNGLYGYSWDMMVHSYDTVLTSIKIVDNNNGNLHYLQPYAYTAYDRWTKYADMALQHAKCIQTNVLEDYAKDPHHSPLSSTNFSIYFDIWCSMNGRFQQRVFDPRIDLLQAKWAPLERTTWLLPLLNELNHMRPKLKTIANEVLMWNNYSDVIFVADYPGLTLDNFIAEDLTNVTLTILEGNVKFKSDDEPEAYFLTAGKSFALKSGIAHHVTTVGLKPSCYLYTYVNKTMQAAGIMIDDSFKENVSGEGSKLPLWQEFTERIVNYKKFLAHMANCLLFIFYMVPIPLEIRERN